MGAGLKRDLSVHSGQSAPAPLQFSSYGQFHRAFRYQVEEQTVLLGLLVPLSKQLQYCRRPHRHHSKQVVWTEIRPLVAEESQEDQRHQLGQFAVLVAASVAPIAVRRLPVAAASSSVAPRLPAVATTSPVAVPRLPAAAVASVVASSVRATAADAPVPVAADVPVPVAADAPVLVAAPVPAAD